MNSLTGKGLLEKNGAHNGVMMWLDNIHVHIRKMDTKFNIIAKVSHGIEFAEKERKLALGPKVLMISIFYYGLFNLYSIDIFFLAILVYI